MYGSGLMIATSILGIACGFGFGIFVERRKSRAAQDYEDARHSLIMSITLRSISEQLEAGDKQLATTSLRSISNSNYNIYRNAIKRLSPSAIIELKKKSTISEDILRRVEATSGESL